MGEENESMEQRGMSKKKTKKKPDPKRSRAAKKGWETRRSRIRIPSFEELMGIQRRRSPRARAADAAKTAKVVLRPTDPRVVSWMKRPGRYDVKGIDTKAKKKVAVKRTTVKKIAGKGKLSDSELRSIRQRLLEVERAVNEGRTKDAVKILDTLTPRQKRAFAKKVTVLRYAIMERIPYNAAMRKWDVTEEWAGITAKTHGSKASETMRGGLKELFEKGYDVRTVGGGIATPIPQTIERETDKAILLKPAGVWLPKSQIKVEGKRITVPSWLVYKKFR